jgi:hypothetical protein
MAENKNPTEQPTSAEAQKPAAKEEKKVKIKQPDGPPMPVLVEFVFTFSKVLLIMVFLVMSAVSWLNGATLLDFVLRTSVTMLVLGGLLMLLTQQISTGVLTTSLAELEEEKNDEKSDKTENSTSLENSEIQSIPEAQ